MENSQQTRLCGARSGSPQLLKIAELETVGSCAALTDVLSNEALFIRLRLVPVESTHDLAKLILLPILYSVSRVNAYLNSQHPYECPSLTS